MVNKKKKGGARKNSASPVVNKPVEEEVAEEGGINPELAETPAPPELPAATSDNEDSKDHDDSPAAPAAADDEPSQTPEMVTDYRDTCTPEHFKQQTDALSQESEGLMNKELMEKIQAMQVELNKMTEEKARDLAANLESENKIAELTDQLTASNERLRISLENVDLARESSERVRAAAVEETRREEQQKSAEALKFEIESREYIDTELLSIKDQLKEREKTVEDLSEKLKTIEQALDSNQTELTKLTDRAENAEGQTRVFEQRALVAESALSKSQDEITKLERQIKALETQSNEDLTSTKDRMSAEISKAVDSIHETVRSRIRKVICDIKTKYPDMTNKFGEKLPLEDLPDSSTAICALDNICSLNENLLNLSQDLTARCDSQQGQIDRYQTDLASAETVKEQLQSEVHCLKEQGEREVREKESEIKTLKEEVASLERERTQIGESHQSELQLLKDEIHTLETKMKELAAELTQKNSMLVDVENIAQAHEKGYAECLEQLEKAAEETIQLTAAIDQHKIDEELRFKKLREEHAANMLKCIQKTEAEVTARAELIEERLKELSEENDELKKDLKWTKEELAEKERRVSALDQALCQAHAEHVEVTRRAEATILEFNKQKNDLQNIMHDFNNQLSTKTEEMEQLEQTLRTQLKDQLEQQYKKQLETLQKRLNGSSRAIIELETELGQKNLTIGNLTEKIRKHELAQMNGAHGIDSLQPPPHNNGGGAGFFRFF